MVLFRTFLKGKFNLEVCFACPSLRCLNFKFGSFPFVPFKYFHINDRVIVKNTNLKELQNIGALEF